jgi:hypothetical protein
MHRFSDPAVGRFVTACVAYFVLAVGAMHVLRPDLDPLTVPMSAYVPGPYGFVMTTTFFVLAAGLFAVAYGLVRSLPRNGITSIAFVLTAIAAIGIVVAGLFPTDWPPPFQSDASRVHQQAAMVAFPALTLVPGLFSVQFGRLGAWRAIAPAALTLSAAVVGAEVFVLVTGSRQFYGIGGLIQRLFLAFLLGWMFVVARHLGRGARDGVIP